MSDISRAAAYDDVYKLTELSIRHRSDPAKVAKIADAIEESIPTLDPVRFRGELEHVLEGPDLPELERAKEMAKAALEGRLVEGTEQGGAARPAPTMRSLLGLGALFGRRPSRPRD